MSKRYPVHDGLALTAAAHPIGTAVDEDADIDPAAEELFDQAIIGAAVEWLAALDKVMASCVFADVQHWRDAEARLAEAVRAKRRGEP